MRQIERNRNPGHPFRGEPVVGQPEVRLEDDPAALELPVQLLDPAVEPRPVDAQRAREVGEAQIEDLLVAPALPAGREAAAAWLAACGGLGHPGEARSGDESRGAIGPVHVPPYRMTEKQICSTLPSWEHAFRPISATRD